ncbi:MAG: pyruvate formate-lyase [Clostridia bacterium]|nr:pyruvate formate-lyase [Clostridia bacterium]
MTPKIQAMLNALKSGAYKQNRTIIKKELPEEKTATQAIENLRFAVSVETPYIDAIDDFGFNRGCNLLMNYVEGNIIADYARILEGGFDAEIAQIKKSMSETNDPQKIEFGNAMLAFTDIVFSVCEKHRLLAQEKGNARLADALTRIPRQGAKCFYEALLMMKISIFFWRLSGGTHQALGRFDQYMFPYFKMDKEKGVSDEELFELLESFFISINKDTDLYAGVQQGDNGQSMVLGGFDKDGNSMYNALSRMCMQASLELNLIDPKINLRVGKNTPDDLYIFGTKLTKQGLGFPQYCNDDVVVPGLIALGYAPEDALNYGVAACWEYIVSGCGVDHPNAATMDFPHITAKAITENLLCCETFEALMDCVKTAIAKECDNIVEFGKTITYLSSPVMSFFMDGPAKHLQDMRVCGKYRNKGCHGAGISNATDALSAIKKNIYDEKNMTKQELLDALSANFEGFDALRHLLRESPKMGNNDDFADDIACALMQTFSDNLHGRDNEHSGIWRAGTGSAMEYLWKGEKCPATADGRKQGEPYSSSFSPSLDIKTNGLLSVIQSFTKYDMTKIINGGPLTLEIHDTVLRNDIGIEKTAMLVKNFVLLGGHQLQLNSINRERLLDAQKHPENYPNLIVRVWGWSGYFNELDVGYQNHIIRRTEYIS